MIRPDKESKERMAQTVRLVIARRERAPRSPRMERALKRLIWRYSQMMREGNEQGSVDDQE